MKKLYFLNEEEKQRILKLHRQQKNLLDEQTAFETGTNVAGTTAGYAGTGAAIGAAATAWAGGVGAVPGAIIGGIYGLLSSISSIQGRGEFIKKVETACSTKKDLGSPSLDAGKINALAEKINDYITGPGSYGGYSSDAEIEGLKELFNGVPTLPDVCAIAEQYEEMYGNTLMGALSNEIYTDSAFSRGVRAPIQKAIKASMDITDQGGGKGGKTLPKVDKKGNLVAGPEDPTYQQAELKIYDKYPCFDGIGITMTRAVNVFRVEKPNLSGKILERDKNNRLAPTQIVSPTSFDVANNTYTTQDDYQNGKVPSGMFSCSVDGYSVELSAGKTFGKPGGLLDKYKCLEKFGVKEVEGGDGSEGYMDKGDVLRHPALSTYPMDDEGVVYFYLDGTFVTSYDENRDIDESGRFYCNKRSTKIVIPAYKKGDYSTLPITPVPDKTDDTKKSEDDTKKVTPTPRSGMGVVNNDAKPLVAEILKCANIVGSVLTQGNLNLLYQYIKNNKK